MRRGAAKGRLDRGGVRLRWRARSCCCVARDFANVAASAHSRCRPSFGARAGSQRVHSAASCVEPLEHAAELARLHPSLLFTPLRRGAARHWARCQDRQVATQSRRTADCRRRIHFLLQRPKIALAAGAAPRTPPASGIAMAQGEVHFSQFPLEFQEKWALALAAEVSRGAGGGGGEGSMTAIAARRHGQVPACRT